MMRTKATTKTTTAANDNDAAAAAESFLLTQDLNRPANHAFNYGAEEEDEDLLPLDEDVAAPSSSRCLLADDDRRHHHDGRTARNHCAVASQLDFDDPEDEFETLDDDKLAALDVDNIVVG
jgi:hypothetical protein